MNLLEKTNLFEQSLLKEEMEIEKSRNGYYTVTFINKNNLEENDIRREFSTVGNVCRIIQNFQRVFIRFKEKEEAERALKKFGKALDLGMAKNNKISDIPKNVGNTHKGSFSHLANMPTPESSSLALTGDKTNSGKVFHLILGNLPKNYTIMDVKALVEEAKPVCINQMDETKVFNLKFCHIVLDSYENLTYLIDKLDGFVICGEKLIAAETRKLLEWRERTFMTKALPGKEVYYYNCYGHLMSRRYT